MCLVARSLSVVNNIYTGFQVGDVIPVIYHVENGSGRHVALRCELVERINFIASNSRIRSVNNSVDKHVSEYILPHTTSGEMYACQTCRATTSSSYESIKYHQVISFKCYVGCSEWY